MNASTEAGWGRGSRIRSYCICGSKSLEPSFGLFILGGVYLVEEAEVHNGLEVTVLGG